MHIFTEMCVWVPQATSKFGVTRTTGLKGDLIYFAHDGPQVTGQSFEDRAESVRNGGLVQLVLVGPEGQHDNLAKWILGKSVLDARAHVCFNHLKVRARIDTALGNPAARHDLPSWDAVVNACRGLATDLEARARWIELDSVAGVAEQIAHVEADDTAQVRNPEAGDGLSRVGLFSSSSSADDVQRAPFRAVQAALNQTAEHIEGDISVGSEVEIDTDPDGWQTGYSVTHVHRSGYDVRHNASGHCQCGVAHQHIRLATPSGQTSDTDTAASAGVDVHETSPTDGNSPPLPVPIPRASVATSEFENNGFHLMQLFRPVFPLMRWTGTVEGDVTTVLTSQPLAANGTLTNTTTRHLLLQFTTAAAHTPSLIFVLANQKQRHATISAVNARVKHKAFDKFVEVTTAEGFDERLQNSVVDPNSPDGRQLSRELLPLMALAAKERPWSRMERSAVIPKMLGLMRRHGDPSVFYTVSLDDVHQTISVRLSFASQSNRQFPSYAGNQDRMDHFGMRTCTDEPGWDQFLGAVREGGELKAEQYTNTAATDGADTGATEGDQGTQGVEAPEQCAGTSRCVTLSSCVYCAVEGRRLPVAGKSCSSPKVVCSGSHPTILWLQLISTRMPWTPFTMSSSDCPMRSIGRAPTHCWIAFKQGTSVPPAAAGVVCSGFVLHMYTSLRSAVERPSMSTVLCGRVCRRACWPPRHRTRHGCVASPRPSRHTCAPMWTGRCMWCIALARF